MPAKTTHDKRKTNRVRKLIEKHTKTREPFGGVFTKRSTGERRVMTCQQQRDNDYHPQPNRPYDPTKYGLLPVFDVIKEGWRSIPLDGVLTLSIDGTLYEV